MKKNFWYVYLYEDKEKKDIFKIMKFDTINEMSKVMNLKPAVLSNYFHGLIKPRDILEYCVIYQSIPL
jgi:hypothetical protein|tara:strand:+ start:1515 stop:1718 length:204 start_codon:yes stop_codon:yes gene_type:complete